MSGAHGIATTTVVDEIRARARERPDHAALVVDRNDGPAERVNYAALVDAFDAHAARLRQHGAAAGDRCGLVARQGRGFVEAALGILAADLCLVPIADDLTSAGVDHLAREAFLQHLVREAEGFRCCGCTAAATLPDAAESAFRALRPAYLRFTSGTTARHKGVVIGHDAIGARLTHANAALAIGADDRVVWLLPMAHQFVGSILLYLRFGATVLLPTSSLARPVLALAGREGATVFYASPYHYGVLAKDTSSAGLDGVRLAVATADGLRADTAARFTRRFGRSLVQALGIIEVGLPVVNLASAATKPSALGRPLPGYEVWLRGESGDAIAATGTAAAIGEICIRGPGMFDAYLNPWTPAAAVLEPDGFRTGDQGWFDADGDLHLAGRHANRISMAGLKFFCEEVEAALEEHPDVRCARVSGRPHEHLGEVPVAEVVAADPARAPDAAALAAHCRARLASYNVPRAFVLVADLPRTPTGKLRRW
jgi:long-chain acyl-CoA synthetase